jgi:hypothetical protein
MEQNLFLDEVMEVSKAGDLDTFDFVIPENHCFFANSVLVHNSGDIENCADIVIFIHRQKGSTEAELIVAKNRYGSKGIVPVIWNRERTRYENAARQKEED